MIFDPKQFYNFYLKDYHKTKAIYLKKILDNIEKFENIFFDENTDVEIIDNFKRTIQCELRHNYFHAIETFFELFFALDPRGKKVLDDKNVQFKLTNSKWRTTFKKIEKIKEDEKALDFLFEKMTYGDEQITIGHFLFYTGIRIEKFSKQFEEELIESIEAIKKTIRIMASDFLARDEYNAYKHGLRLIPSITELSLLNTNTGEKEMTWNLNESMSFYKPTINPDVLTVVTKVFDSGRDHQMAYLCSNLIHHLVYFRRIAMGIQKDKNEKYPITLFGKELVADCFKINVSIQDLEFTVTKENK
jgi:hypothetical protein